MVGGMKAKTISFVIIMLTVSQLAYAGWKVQFDSETIMKKSKTGL
jgi:hypothetical protein